MSSDDTGSCHRVQPHSSPFSSFAASSSSPLPARRPLTTARPRKQALHLPSSSSPSSLLLLLLLVASLASAGHGDNGNRAGGDDDDAAFARFNGAPGQGHVFTSLLVHRTTGHVYIGGKNHIWQLSSDLRQAHLVQRGPVNDSLSCGPPPARLCVGDAGATPARYQERSNFVLALHADYAGGHLVACGNVYRGACELLPLGDIAAGGGGGGSLYYPSGTAGFVIPPTLTSPSLISSTMSANNKKLFIATPAFSGDGVRNPVLRTLSTSNYQMATEYSEMLIMNSGKDFPSAWIASFTAGGFVYFVYTEQIDGKKAKPSTTLVRICGDDGGYVTSRYSGYGSYVEMEYSYTGKGLAPSGSFAQVAALVHTGHRLVANAPDASLSRKHHIIATVFDELVPGGSLISILPLEWVDDAMRDREILCGRNLRSVMAGTKNVGSIKFSSCNGYHTENNSTTVCGRPKHTPLTVPALELNDSSIVLRLQSGYRVRSLIGASYGDHTVLFAGTDTGHVLKILVNTFGLGSARVFDDLEVDALKRPIIKLLLSPTKSSLYALANVTGSGATPSSEVIKVPVFGCGRFKTCSSCTSPKSFLGLPVVNPLCGWCQYEGRCTSKLACKNISGFERYFHQNSTVCPSIESISPALVSHLTPTNITIQVANLPRSPPGARYQCWFGSTESKFNTTYNASSGQYTCLAKFNISQGLQDIPFGLYLKASNAVFLQYGGLKGFNCRVHTRCDSCLSTPAMCGWCRYTNLCTVTRAECGEGDQSPWTKADVKTVCPKTSTTHEVQAVDRVRQFEITAVNLPVPRIGTLDTYKCSLRSNDSSSDVIMDAVLKPNKPSTVECQEMEFSSDRMLNGGSLGWVEKQLVVLWNNVDISGDEATRVAFYNCEILAKQDCSLCIAQLDVPRAYPSAKRFQCRWCLSTKTCAVDSSCTASSQRCPNPELTKISPSSGPRRGGTLVVVNGTNMGSRRSDLTSVIVNEALCNITSYTPARGLECVTSGKDQTNVRPGAVVIKLYNDTRSSSPNHVDFKYTTPKFTGIHPNTAPKSGGTLVTLTGSDLDTGRDVEVTLAGVPCTLATASCHNRPPPLCALLPKEARNSSTIWCYTSNNSRLTGHRHITGDMKLTIDGYRVSQHEVASFSYYPDPLLRENSVSPAEGVVSGGINLVFKGKHFGAVRHMAVIIRDRIGDSVLENSTLCRSHTNTTAHCPMPAFNKTTPYATVVLLSDGHEMEVTRNFHVRPDPQVGLPDSPPLAFDGLMRIPGVSLDSVEKREYRIYVGQTGTPYLCNVSSVESAELICRMPSSLQAASGESYGVAVHVGENIRVYVGEVHFPDPSLAEQTDSNVNSIAGGVAGGAAFLLVIFLLLFLYCQQRARAAENEVVRMISHMETLETNVASVCKSAFTDLMTDLGDHGISTADDKLPYLPFHQYAMRSMFPSAGDDHPMLQSLDKRLSHLVPSRLEHTRRTLATFQRTLVYNKKFLVIFVHALELHFGMKDRVAFASVLMVALHDKLEYATEVLKCLLADHIRSSVRKSHPKLLLRRMETVAEKLLANWLTFCLHDYVRTYAGRPLYLLFQAVKAQTERGPCDALTGEARYSLSEEKLLREPVECTELICTFHRQEGAPISVRLQDCDTISQAKEKIMDATFKTAPVSTRPDLSSVDLAMDSDGGPTPIILRDEDMTTVLEGTYKKLNTLRHYEVLNGANLHFVTQGAQSKRSEMSGDFISTFSPPQMTLPMSDDGLRPYHLVKQDYELTTERQSFKMVHEVFLTRLLLTKKVLSRFVNDLVWKVFSIGTPSRLAPPIPEAVKYLFDFLDQQAAEYGIDEPDVVHTWKNNSVPLRFWINIIKNPDFVFDIHKSATVDSSLSVVAQMVMDSCGTTDQRLTKESPTTKLLYAREVRDSRKLVEKYYADIQAMPVILEGRMHDILQQASVGADRSGFQKDSAMYDVFIYGLHYRDSVSAALKGEGMHEMARQFEDVCDELAHGFDEKSSSL